MEWLRAHPYVLALAVAAILIVAGAALVASRAPVAPSQSALTWSGGTPLAAYQSAASQQSPQQIAQDVIQSQNPATLMLPPLATSTASTSVSFAPTSGSLDYVALLAQLSAGAKAPSSAQQNDSGSGAIAEAYQFIPTGLIATTAPTKKPMTPQQQALYDYGNEVGGEIKSFEELHTNETEVIKDQAEDRTDPTKAAALVSLGQGFASVGTFLQQMQNVPAQAQSLHDALAQSYLDVGAKLQLVAQARSDADFVQAIETYDSTANTFVHNYAALAQFFSEQSVTFSSDDPGNVFSFTDSGGGL